MPAPRVRIVRILTVLVLAVVAAAAFIRPRERRVARAVKDPPPAAGHEHLTRDGLVAVDAPALLERVKRSRAKGVVINAWASWCGSCKADLPALLGLRKTFGADIDVFLVSVDEEASMPIAAELLRGFGAPAPNFIVDQPLAAFKAAINPRWPGMLPATFLFDGSGKLRYFWGGPVMENEITPLLRRYLAGEHIDGEANFALAPGAVSH
jgi:thiol-disulfide isomerase/thioredoxin